MRTLDFLNELADRVKYPQMDTIENATLTPEQRKLIRAANRVIRTMGGIYPWPLLREEGAIVTVAYKTSDTTSGSEQYVTATQGSDTITIANGDFTNIYENWAIQISGDDYVYRIKRVVSATTLQLNKVWVSDSITAADDERTFTAAMDRYALPLDFDRAMDDLQSFFGPYGIKPVSPEEFRAHRRRDRDMVVGDPEYFTIFGLTPTQTAQMIHFHPFPKESRMLTFDYQRVHPTLNSDNDLILFEERFIEALLETIIWLVDRDYEEDEKVAQTLADALRHYNQQAANPTVTGPRWWLRPDGSMRSDTYAALRRSGYQIDYGDYFDRHETYGW